MDRLAVNEFEYSAVAPKNNGLLVKAATKLIKVNITHSASDVSPCSPLGKRKQRKGRDPNDAPGKRFYDF